MPMQCLSVIRCGELFRCGSSRFYLNGDLPEISTRKRQGAGLMYQLLILLRSYLNRGNYQIMLFAKNTNKGHKS